LSLANPRRIFRQAPRRSQRFSRGNNGLSRGVSIALLSLLGVTFIAGGVEHSTAAIGRIPPASQVASLPGQTQVVDGETLRLGDVVIHLTGITAPARETQNGVPAAAAIRTLAALVHDQRVDCRVTGADAAGRAQGTCHTDTTDLAHAMISAGAAQPLIAPSSGT